MGDVVECKASFNNQISNGKALLETNELIFRGDFRVKVPLKEIKSLASKDGKLVVGSPHGNLTLELGRYADKWVDKIRNPKSVIDKLGIKAGQVVSLVGLNDQSFIDELMARGIQTSIGRAKKDSHAVFLLANDSRELKRLATLKSSIKSDGAIWVVFPKGKQHIREIDVLHKGREAGLVDTKVVGFSEVYTAHKFVIPVADR